MKRGIDRTYECTNVCNAAGDHSVLVEDRRVIKTELMADCSQLHK